MNGPERIVATYRIETPLDPRKAADMIAAEQSSGTFVAVPGETEALKAKHAARVESVDVLDVRDTPTLPGSRGGARFTSARIRVSWPQENVGNNLPLLCSTLLGNLFELSQLSALRLEQFELPTSMSDAFTGPHFGVEGTRRLCGVAHDVLIGTIVKPSIGLSPQQTADRVATLVGAGIDFIKDDELMASPAHSPLEQRVDAVMAVLREYESRTGKRVLYAFNITGDFDAMRRGYDHIFKAGGACVMLSLNYVGLPATQAICKDGRLAVHGHRNGWGMLTRHPDLGLDFEAYQLLWRLAGVDHLHVNGIANKFYESDDSVVASIQACGRHVGRGERLLPVVSSGQWGGQAPETFRRTQTRDLLYLAGGGIAAHPDGPAAGVVAIREAWEAAVSGEPLNAYATTHPALRAAIGKFAAPGDGA